jgi:hypothetical protein
LAEGLASLGLRELRRIAGGWQSLAVYEARLDGQRVAVKALDSRLTDRGALRVRLEVLSRLATTSDIVCIGGVAHDAPRVRPPLPRNGDLTGHRM